MKYFKYLILLLTVLMLIPAAQSYAAFGEDFEKPKPEFTREQDKIIAKFIPRAKSTSVTIGFEVLGGKLKEVTPVDFATANRPGVDSKDFRSELYMLEITDVKPGAEVSVSMSSSFFSSSTEIWVFNEKLKDSWIKTDTQNMPLADRVRQLVFQVKDGGTFDGDGAADGKIVLVCGPKDSFWGYAIGTLFIRFFGIFIVLGVLMIGMILSGKLFQTIEEKQSKAVVKPKPVMPAAPSEKPIEPEKDEISPEMAAAIAAALHAHFTAAQSSEPLDLSQSFMTGWTQHGRQQMMTDRFKTFNR
jgi:Na+-transporting methylmalonyl-CoA/oxaloacetate decarboxylase gamma subunit